MMNFSKLFIAIFISVDLVFAVGLSTPSGEFTSSDLKIIENQSWVASTQLSKPQLKKIIKKYDSFEIIDYDSLYGFLIEYNHKDINVLEDLKRLKMEPKIKVFNKVYEGKDAFILNK